MILILMLGLIFGSFLNVLIYRLPRGQSIVKPGSRCPGCGTPIKWYSNIPVLSWVAQRGRCKACGMYISAQYPLVELATGALFVLIYLRFGQTLDTVKYCMFVYLLLGAGFTDFFTARDVEHFETGIIPNFYTLGGALAGFAWALFTEPGLAQSFAGAGAGAFSLLIIGYIYSAIKGQEGIGDGDAMLLGMVGSFLGLTPILFIFTVGAIMGAVIGLVVVIVSKNRYIRFPFGPMLAAAAILYLFFSEWFNGLIL